MNEEESRNFMSIYTQEYIDAVTLGFYSDPRTVFMNGSRVCYDQNVEVTA